MRIGITGQGGFIGWHASQYFHLLDEVTIIPFEKESFNDVTRLSRFVEQCDVILHLAAMNRHPVPQVIYDTNIHLVNQLIAACEYHKPVIYMSSSTQENSDSLYGQSKKDGWKLLSDWASETGALVGSFVIPNVFGPFGSPNYNSFVATFCDKLANDKIATVIEDKDVDLIHVHDLVKTIWKSIKAQQIGRIVVPESYNIKVSHLLGLLEEYRDDYLHNGKMPDLKDRFSLQLFNMYRTYIPLDHFPVHFTKHTDDRGSFVEIVRANTSGQFSFSTTVPGVTRGNHFHTRKAERFAVIKGKAKIQLRKVDTDEVIDYYLDGDQPSYVDIPIWYTHNITNIGDVELVTLFWINEPYNPEDSDTFFVEV